MRFIVSALALALTGVAAPALADDCQDGEVVIKFSHVVAETGHPKGEAAAAPPPEAKRKSKDVEGP